MFNFSGQEWRVDEFLSSGIWDMPTGIAKCEAIILLIGGGQGGGSGSASAQGGSPGQARIEYVILDQSSYTVTIGAGGTQNTIIGYAGGDTYFGSLLVAKGGASEAESLYAYPQVNYNVPMVGNTLYHYSGWGSRYGSPYAPCGSLCFSIQPFTSLTGWGVNYRHSASNWYGGAGYRGDALYMQNQSANTGAGGCASSGTGYTGASGYCAIAYRVV